MHSMNCLLLGMPLQGRRKYEEADERILNIVNRFKIGTVIEYLEGISHNLKID